MKAALITGASGLIGGEVVEFFVDKFDVLVGIDNNMRSYFLGEPASTGWKRGRLQADFAKYHSAWHFSYDLTSTLIQIFNELRHRQPV